MKQLEHVGDEWDFYPCRVDDADASISLNLWFEANAPLASASTLYWLRIAMLDAGDHGMGTPAEAAILNPLEDDIVARSMTVGCYYVGRLRNHGVWQLAFYGPANQLDALRRFSANAAGRSVEVGTKTDREWDYYRSFLLPDAERRQWMQDRRLVEVLEEHGDQLAARRVDHWTYFPTVSERQAFIVEAVREGFTLEGTDDAPSELGLGSQIFRIDCVDLDHIHEVVMGLVELAERHQGTYDGWETQVTTK